MINIYKIIVLHVILYINYIPCLKAKYVEGVLRTSEDWAFVARFCFLSGRGRYEYEIEFERRFGEPQLLLYYDSATQWPAIYKQDKTCQQKLSVLSKENNQIVTLSTRTPYSFYSGCSLRKIDDNPIKSSTTPEPVKTTTVESIDPTYFNQFLVTSTDSSILSSENNATSFEQLEDVDFIEVNGTDNMFNTTRNHQSIYKADSNYFKNQLDNSTNLVEDIEELFKSNLSRIKRAKEKNFENKKYVVNCHNFGGFTSSRERWWYIAIANCGSRKGLEIKYKFRMTNGPSGDFWHEHFSADEMYIMPILFAEAICYFFMLLAVFFCAVELKTRQLFHCTYRLFAFSVLMQCIGIVCLSVTYTKYAVTGYGPSTTIGYIFMGGSETSFLTLLLIMAKGYTITRGRLSTCSSIKLTFLIYFYLTIYLSLFIYQDMAFDPGQVLNLYESPAGLGLCALRLGCWIAFIVSVIATVWKYPQKSSFYYPFGILGSFWILGGPILTMIGIVALDAWVRESVMFGYSALLSLVGHGSFLWLTWPSRANSSFPYHVKTNHVGVARLDSDGEYPSHTYAPEVQNSGVIIPLSRRTEELLGDVYDRYINDNNSKESNGSALIQTINTITKGNGSVSNTQRQIEPGCETTCSDSGHPSMEYPSLVGEETIETNNQNESKSSVPILKPLTNNPFLVNGLNKPPNKIILEPIVDHKQLFAVKNNSMT